MTQPEILKTIELDSAEDFVAHTRLSHDLWKGPSGRWGFRGQANATWKLVASAFRPDFHDRLYQDYPQRFSEPAVQRAYLELQVFLDFFRLADKVGLHVPGSEYILSLPFEERVNYMTVGGWPFPEIIAGLAIAQHHGIPTRLLDFSWSPTVAAFFAARSSIDNEDAECIAVWAINLWFTSNAWGNALNRRIDVVQVPTADNLFFNSQRGFFLHPVMGHLRDYDVLPSIDEIVESRARDSRSKEYMERSDVEPRFVQRPLIYKITLPSKHTRDVLQLLDEQDSVTDASMMPTMDNVRATLEFKRDHQLPI